MAYNEDSSASGHDEPWIQWFCGLKGHEMFCEVERSYIEDGFNLYGLRTCVSNFSDCLDLILDRIGPDDSDDSHLTQSACTLYGLIHARYIITAHGLDAMYNKYASKEFGTCPLVQCAGQPVLPVGLKDEMGADTVKIFCPKCQCVYHPPPVRSRSSHHGGAGAAGVDGAAFGTTFPHLFLMTFSNLVPDPLPQDSAYIPRVFGFRVHMSARQRTTSTGGATSVLASSVVNRGDNNKRSNNASVTKNSDNAGAVFKKDNAAAAEKSAPAAGSKEDTARQNSIQNDTGNAASSTLASAAGTTKAIPKVQDGNNVAEAAAAGNKSANKDGTKKSKLGKQKRSADGETASLKGSDGTSGTGYGSSKRRRKVDIS
eukprot:CAMPEP_0113513074 /NCGR_PEP_ID=MMETSP0014_2-20120614/39666_1 /TAXON_ID=2857 /ORGANISM="Nitzschia sp." /LENGTH=370 /DNA_ID=CAMNT_0000409449 /DNA_START=208 /DNA_END=1320 /DNA_ORIENTATION=- /assembly_acc=CAM_ASM_000159